MKTLIALASAAALLTLGAGHAAAQDNGGARSVMVSYGDLDLGSERGRKALDRRIEQAVGRVCPSRPHISQLQLQKVYAACREVAWTGARQQLAEIYSGRQFAQSSVQVKGPAN